jgi:hypothetical protein
MSNKRLARQLAITGTTAANRSVSIVTDASARSGSGDSEFERFEDLTRRLVHTSKSDVDEKRQGDAPR